MNVPLSIYQEDNSSKEKSDLLNVTLYIRNTDPTIPFKLDGKPFSDNKKIGTDTLNNVEITAKDQAGKKLDTLYLVSSTTKYNTNEEALNSKDWGTYKKTINIAMTKTK